MSEGYEWKETIIETENDIDPTISVRVQGPYEPEDIHPNCGPFCLEIFICQEDSLSTDAVEFKKILNAIPDDLMEMIGYKRIV